MYEIKAGAKQEDVQKFRSDCKNFLIESILQIKQRFDLEAEIHDIVVLHQGMRLLVSHRLWFT